jgi:hypothetical protein
VRYPTGNILLALAGSGLSGWFGHGVVTKLNSMEL